MLGIKVHPLNFLLTRESIPFGLLQLVCQRNTWWNKITQSNYNQGNEKDRLINLIGQSGCLQGYSNRKLMSNEANCVARPVKLLCMPCLTKCPATNINLDIRYHRQWHKKNTTLMHIHTYNRQNGRAITTVTNTKCTNCNLSRKMVILT